MNVHFFVTFSKDASDSVFAQELKKQDIEFQIFSEEISLRYSHRIWLYFVGWPRMLFFAFRQAWRSLKANPKPDWIVVGSHFEVLAINALVNLLGFDKPKIMLMGFIYTSRKSHLIANLKYIYFSKILALVDCAVCHSIAEVEKNTQLFLARRIKFAYIPFGLHLELPAQFEADEDSSPYVVSAGRSGRDYDLLIKCFTQLGYPLHIICDSTNVIKDQQLPSNIKLLRQCYDDCYINQLAGAKMVVIPISVDDISAGQMVLLQAMALQKPIVITNTNTTDHYVENNKTAVFVEKGSLEQMTGAVEELWNNKHLSAFLSKNAKDAFDDYYSMAAYIKNICVLFT